MFGPYATRTNAFAPFPHCVDFLVFIADWCSRRPSYPIFVDYVGSHFDRIWFSFLSITLDRNLIAFGFRCLHVGDWCPRRPLFLAFVNLSRIGDRAAHFFIFGAEPPCLMLSLAQCAS